MTLIPSDRPWPIPARPPALRMIWRDLLFAHWVTDAALLRKLIPSPLELDLFEGRAYVGVVPFRMDGIQPRALPPVPGLSAFPEINLRTYVTAGGKPGVWFFSLDAGQKLAVRTARLWFHLPYFDARFDIALTGARVNYRVTRVHRNQPHAAFAATYEPVGPAYQAQPGSLDSWLTDRYCLYSADTQGRVYRGEIDHPRWPLQQAACTVENNTLGDWLGIDMNGLPQTLHFAESLPVRAWTVQPIA